MAADRRTTMPADPAPSEADRWRVDADLRQREMALKERDHDLRREELALKRAESAQSRYRSPLIVAIFAATVAAGGNALVAFVNGQQTRRVEEVRAEAGRILEMIKTGEADSAAANLDFLARTGLISDPVRLAAIETFLATRAPGEGPALPTAAGGEVARPARDLPADDTLRGLGDSVGRLLIDGRDVCTAFLATSDWLIAPKFCFPGNPQEVTFSHARDSAALDQQVQLRLASAPVETIALPAAPQLPDPALLLLAFETPPIGVLPPAPLSPRAPQVGDLVATIFFRGDSDLMMARDPRCAIVQVTDVMFAHPCAMGGGAGGAPIFSADGAAIIGVHASAGGPDEAKLSWAVRADRILAASTLLQGRPAP